MQYFKATDATEAKMYNSAAPALDLIGGALDSFFTSAYTCSPLFEMLHDYDLAPLTGAISRDIFIDSFDKIVEAFIVAGTFESYLEVFTQIFGEDVDVDFTVPAPGKLNIDITTSNVELTNFVARHIVSNQYVYDQIIDDEGDNIVFQSIKGFTSQYELEQMLFEMVPAGIYTQITLTFG